MSNVVPRVAKVTDHQARCRDCGARLSQPETIITYWDYVTQDGMSGTKITEKGISSIDINAGLCDDCLAKKLRKELDTRSFAAKTQDTGAPGTGAVALCWIGIFVFALLLLLKVTKLDEYGRPAPIFTVWFFIFAAGLLASIIGLPIAISRRKKLCSQAVSTIEEDRLYGHTDDAGTRRDSIRFRDTEDGSSRRDNEETARSEGCGFAAALRSTKLQSQSIVSER